MKLLQNKSTGEIGCLMCLLEKTPNRITVVEYIDGKCGNKVWDYDTLAKLNEEWKDYEESEDAWYINEDNEPQRVCFGLSIEDIENLEEIGLLFKTKEETEKAIEELKACIKAQAERIKSLEQELRNVKAELNKLKGAR